MKNKAQRLKKYNEEVEKLMNPVPIKDFNPKTFDPIKVEGMEDIMIRERKIKKGKLPTYGLKPKELRVGQMIGMYESKQDIYLLLAHKINELYDKVEALENKLKEKQ